jgi:hypothetical protein
LGFLENRKGMASAFKKKPLNVWLPISTVQINPLPPAKFSASKRRKFTPRVRPEVQKKRSRLSRGPY